MAAGAPVMVRGSIFDVARMRLKVLQRRVPFLHKVLVAGSSTRNDKITMLHTKRGSLHFVDPDHPIRKMLSVKGIIVSLALPLAFLSIMLDRCRIIPQLLRLQLRENRPANQQLSHCSHSVGSRYRRRCQLSPSSSCHRASYCSKI